MPRRTTAMLIGCILFACCFPTDLLSGTAKEERPGPGDAAPLFSAADLDGGTVSLEALLKSGKVVLLNFWGVRCSSCIDEIAHLNPMSDVYGKKGVAFLGVNVDGVKGEMIRKLMPAMPHSPKYTVLPDPGFRIPELYNLTAAPLSLVIGRDGKIVYRHEDFREGDEKEVEKALKKALDAEDPRCPR